MATGQKIPRNPGPGATRKTTILALTTLYAAILAAILAGFFYTPARAANAATVRANTPRLMFDESPLERSSLTLVEVPYPLDATIGTLHTR